jgi:poly(A) polymerase
VGGIADLESRTVRFIGNATERIAEDALRILRFFRFHAWYGEGAMDAEGLAACRARRDDIGNLSIERVRAELLRLLEAPSPLPAIHEMRRAEILALVLPEAVHLERLETLVEQGVGDSLLRLAVLTDRRADTLSGLGTRLKLSNREKKRLRCMAAGEVDLPADMDARALYAQTYWLGAERVMDLARLDSACDGRDRGRLVRALEGWSPPVFPMTGADLVRLNIPKGPQLGETLRRLEAWWVEQDFEPDRGALRLHLASLMDDD